MVCFRQQYFKAPKRKELHSLMGLSIAIRVAFVCPQVRRWRLRGAMEGPRLPRSEAVGAPRTGVQGRLRRLRNGFVRGANPPRLHQPSVSSRPFFLFYGTLVHREVGVRRVVDLGSTWPWHAFRT